MMRVRRAAVGAPSTAVLKSPKCGVRPSQATFASTKTEHLCALEHARGTALVGVLLANLHLLNMVGLTAAVKPQRLLEVAQVSTACNNETPYTQWKKTHLVPETSSCRRVPVGTRLHKSDSQYEILSH